MKKFRSENIGCMFIPKVGSATKTIVLSSTCQKSLIANPAVKKGVGSRTKILWKNSKICLFFPPKFTENRTLQQTHRHTYRHK